MNNSSFVDSVASYVRPLLTYLERYENYKLMRVQEPKDTETNKLVTSINDNVEFLKKKMYEASDRDKSSVWINEVNGVSQSEEILKDILAKIIEICLVINSQNINSKLQKRITQVKGNKDKIKKAIHHNDLELKCLNASLSRERAYVDAENNAFSSSGISITDVISAASDV